MQITLFKLDLISKNNLQNGFYLYSPIVKIGDEYYRGESIKSVKPLKKDSFSTSQIEQIKIIRVIAPSFYPQNNIPCN